MLIVDKSTSSLGGYNMNFLKKWMNAIVLFVSGVLGLLLSLCSGMKSSYNINASALGSPYAEMISSSHSETTKAHKIITDSNLADTAKSLGISTEFTWLKVFGIIGVIVSIILIVYAVVLLLKNLNVIKCENKVFDIITLALPAALLVATIGLLVCSLGYANAQEDALLKMLNGTILNSPTTSQYASVIKTSSCVKIGVYQPIILAISVVAVVVVATFTYLKNKQK